MRNGLFSIRLKLAATTIAVVAVLAACIDFALNRYEARNLMASKEAAATMVARLYVATAAAPLTFGDERGVQDAVGLLAANDDIVYASAWSVADDATGLRERLGELRRGAAADPPARVPPRMELRRTDDALIVDAPVADPTGKVVGVVQAVFSLAHEHETLAAMKRRVLGTSVGASLLLTAILLLVVRRMIVEPLARLVSAANALERGEETNVEIGANDEIGRLAAAFVSMSSAIEQREKRIAERNGDMRRVLDNVEDGFLAVTAEGVMSEERSRIIEEWFGPPGPGATLFDYAAQMGGDTFGQWLSLGWESLAEGFVPIVVSLDQLPSRFERDGRFYSVAYRPILEGDALKAMLIVIRDVTKRVELERAEEMQREMMIIFKHALADHTAFDEFFTDATRLVASIEACGSQDDATLRRQIHTLKGNSAIFGLDSITRHCHELESRMIEDDAPPTYAQVAALREIWNRIASTYRKFSGSRQGLIVIDEDEHRNLLCAIENGASDREITMTIASWRYERADVRMAVIGEQANQVALRLGKGGVDVQVAPTKLRIPPRRWASFWSVFGHIVRNAIDHGLEDAATRRALGKPERGAIRMSFEVKDSKVVFRFGDDGAGIDWDRLALRARQLGLPAETRRDLEDALFTDSVSTRDEVCETSGRGVGMSVVLQYVTEQGGTIRLETAPDHGTTWEFTFPISMLFFEETRGSREPPTRMPSRGPRTAKAA